jgi:hypothetical protein
MFRLSRYHLDGTVFPQYESMGYYRNVVPTPVAQKYSVEPLYVSNSLKICCCNVCSIIIGGLQSTMTKLT